MEKKGNTVEKIGNIKEKKGNIKEKKGDTMEKKGSILMQRYELGRMLGQGNFAKVYYARDIKSGESVAIKVIDKEKLSKAGLNEQIKREISVMMLVKHPNVLQLYEVMATKTKVYIVLEYAKGGELFHKVAKGRLKEDFARWIFQQLICAVDCCHKRGVYHRDLKLENLLIDEAGNLKVSDFGLSTVAEAKRQDGLLHTVCGTPAYVAPEVIMRKGYDGAKFDVWSCGVILYSLLAGHLPFFDGNLMEVYKKIKKADYKCPNWFPPEVRKLLSKIMDPNPDTRITIEKIMENSWFKKGLGTRPTKHKVGATVATQVAVDAVCGGNMEDKRNKITNLNAFDLISLSTGFDLSGLFIENNQRLNMSFTSQHPASAIVSKVEEIACSLRLKVAKNDGMSLKLEEDAEARKQGVSIDVDIFEFTPSFYLVELKQSAGDSFEYRKILNQDVKPALKDIVWAWQGDHEQQQRHQLPTPIEIIN